MTTRTRLFRPGPTARTALSAGILVVTDDPGRGPRAPRPRERVETAEPTWTPPRCHWPSRAARCEGAWCRPPAHVVLTGCHGHGLALADPGSGRLLEGPHVPRPVHPRGHPSPRPVQPRRSSPTPCPDTPRERRYCASRPRRGRSAQRAPPPSRSPSRTFACRATCGPATPVRRRSFSSSYNAIQRTVMELPTTTSTTTSTTTTAIDITPTTTSSFLPG